MERLHNYFKNRQSSILTTGATRRRQKINENLFSVNNGNVRI